MSAVTQTPELPKAKYLQIMREKGLQAALTQIHRDMWTIENQCFEGPSGYRPDLYEALRKYREFSRELFEMDPSRSGPPQA